MSFFGAIGGAVQDFFGAAAASDTAEGDRDAASAYRKAEHIAEQNAELTGVSTQIQEAQLHRKVEQTIGAETADVAAANLAGGTAGDLMRSSLQQGALANAVVAAQGGVNRNAFEQQATAYEGMAESADAAANAADKSSMGGLLGGALGLLGAFL